MNIFKGYLKIFQWSIIFLCMFALKVDGYAFCFEGHDYITDDQKCIFHGNNLYQSGTQGMCVADHYMIYTRWSSNYSATTYVVVDLETKKEVGTYDFYTSHSNSLTYNPDTKQIVCAYGGQVYFLGFHDGELYYEGSTWISHNSPKIVYDQERKVYYVGTTNYIFETTNFEYLSLKFYTKSYGVNQGMGFDGRYLYIPWLCYGEDVISVYDLNGYEVDCYGVSASYKEVEEVDFYGDKMLMSVTSSGAIDGVYEINSYHRFGEAVVKEKETCGTDGYQEKTCQLCNYVKRETRPATGDHKPGAWQVVKEPVCGVEGLKIKTCKVCHQKVQSAKIEALSHIYTHWVETVSPTVLKSGMKIKICNLCGVHENKQIPRLRAKLQISIEGNEAYATMNVGDYIDSIIAVDKEDKNMFSYYRNQLIAKEYGESDLIIESKGGASEKIHLIVSKYPAFRLWLHNCFGYDDRTVIAKKGEFFCISKKEMELTNIEDRDGQISMAHNEKKSLFRSRYYNKKDRNNVSNNNQRKNSWNES